MRLDRPRPGATFGFQRQLGCGVQVTAEGKIGKALLRDIRMLVPFIRTESVKRLYPEDTDNAAEDVSLLEV